MDQLIRIGDGQVPVYATYYEDECGPLVITDLQLLGTPGKPGPSIVGCFTGDELDAMAKQLHAGHGRAMRDLIAQHHEDRAAERAADREAFA